MSYSTSRAEQIGLTPDLNTVSVWLPGGSRPLDWQLLATEPSTDNLLLLHLDLRMREGAFVALSHAATQLNFYTQIEEVVQVPYQCTRLKNPKPGQAKYINPSGVPAQPYLSPSLITAFNNMQAINTLVITEGALKALKGCLCGLFVIGINGIWGFREPKGQDLHPFIQQIVKQCQVKNLVYLHDADCREIHVKYGNDLAERPGSFASSVSTFGKTAKQYANTSHNKDLNLYYAHPNEGGPKGLDDLLCSLSDTDKATAELDQPNSRAKNRYFKIHNLKEEFKTIGAVKSYFYLDSVNSFYDNYQELISDDFFIFQGDQYRFNEETETLDCTLNKTVAEYTLVGNKYYQDIYKTNSKGLPDLLRDPRLSSIIIDHFKREGLPKPYELITKIPKYDSFANEPDFINYRKEIPTLKGHKNLNLTYELMHIPAEGSWPVTQQFLSHIFHNNGDTKLDIGLDMLQMYYLKPKQKQRILCLVGEKNETGKTTFLMWLRDIFGQNMSVIGNEELTGQFNGYVTKSLLGVDESKIDDPKAIAAIKSLITSDYVYKNTKMVQADDEVSHLKLILTTNHVFDFAHIRKEENKWFVLEVDKKEGGIDNTLRDQMYTEIPAFLHYLQNRKLAHYSKGSRFGIADEQVETKALKRIKESSKSPIMQQIEAYVQGHFLEFPQEQTLKIAAKDLYEQLFPIKNYRHTPFEISKTLNQEYKMFADKKAGWYRIPVKTPLEQEFINEQTGEVITHELSWLTGTGKLFTFKREDWEEKN